MSKTFTLKLFDHNDQASFAQAVEIALAQSHLELRTPGTLVQEPRRGGRPFLYWHRYTPDGKLEKQYVGPLGGKGEAAARQQIQELLLLRETAKKLRKLGFAAVDNSTALTPWRSCATLGYSTVELYLLVRTRTAPCSTALGLASFPTRSRKM